MVKFFYQTLLILYFFVVVVPSYHAQNIIILAGQSNMAGSGGVIYSTWNGYVPPESHPNPAVLRLNAGLVFEEGHEPLHKDIDVGRTCGVGPGLVFANAILARNPSLGPVQLVPCAIGGTSIKSWVRGGRIYNQTVKRVKAHIDKMREAQFGIGLPNVKVADAKGLELGPDKLHLTTSAQVRLGKMLADKFFQ